MLFHIILITLEESSTIPVLEMWAMGLRSKWHAKVNQKQWSQDSNPGLQIPPGHSTVHSTVGNPFM